MPVEPIFIKRAATKRGAVNALLCFFYSSIVRFVNSKDSLKMKTTYAYRRKMAYKIKYFLAKSINSKAFTGKISRLVLQ